jgi:hypothetical protein
VATAALASLLVVALAEDAGGYYPTSWGWGMLAASALGAAALLLRRGVPLGRREWAVVATFAAWLLWVGAEATRAGAATAGAPVLERGALYLLVLWSALLVVRPRSLEWLVAGLAAGLTAVACIGLHRYLAAAAVPNAFEGRLLYAPVGYANAAGILCGLGALLTLGLAVHARARVARAVCACALVPLLDATAFTQSRGAVVAVGAGAAVLVAVDRRRARLASTLLVTLPFPLAGIVAASRLHVGDAHVAAGVAQHDGRLLAFVLVALTIAAAAVSWRTLADDGAGRRGHRFGLVSLAAFSTAASAAVVARGGAGVLGDRAAYWRAAAHDVVAQPLLGSGPGSFPSAWLRYRDVARSTLDAHNLYLQTLAEVGPLGLVLLVAALAIPLGAIRAARRRDERYAAAIAAAYVAALVHSALDWDWQIPAVASVVVVLAAALLVAARDVGPGAGSRLFAAAAAATVVAAAAGAFVAAGNATLAAAGHAASAGDWPRARALALAAEARQPWSSDPLLVVGEASAALGDGRAAQAAFAEATRRDPSSWRAWYDLAIASRGIERRRALGELRRLDPLSGGAAPGGAPGPPLGR